MQMTLNTKSLDDYRSFLKIKRLPAWSIRGSAASFPDEYADRIGVVAPVARADYSPEPFLFDYQAAITETAIKRRKFAVFADCGLGKSLILLSYARHVRERLGPAKRVLILTPAMVVGQLAAEAERFWGEDLPVEQVKANGLAEWLCGEGPAVGITNYEALKADTPQGNLGAMILDESSVLKSHYGNYAGICLRLGQGLNWKLALTGTPAPNDRIEYANHAVFLDRFPTVNAFLATYFINRGQTGERWELKPHAIGSFYRALSDWCVFLTDPAVYGWKDNCDTIPPIHTHIHDVPLTPDQRDWVHNELGTLVATRTGGITMRASYGQVSKGEYKGRKFETLKYDVISDLVGSWSEEESTLVWCIYDHEQRRCHEVLGDGWAESMDGKTPHAQRQSMIERFKSGETRSLISKPRILGFGLNLQVATRQVFSGLQDSYEQFYQAVKRSNRIGSTKPLNVHIPITELEAPMVENVLSKAHRVESDAREQEQLFYEALND